MEIRVFRMFRTPDGGSTTDASVVGKSERETPDFWDVVLEDDDGDAIEEYENLTAEEAMTGIVTQLELRFPDADIDWGDPF